MTERVHLFGIDIDSVRMPQAVDRILDWTVQPERGCRFVVTPNVDHTVMLQRHEGLRQAYDAADMVLADGLPVVLASRILRRGLPERVPGSDLVPALLETAHRNKHFPLRLFLLGAAAGVADRAAGNIERRWPTVQVVGTYSPPLGFENDQRQNRQILEMVSAARPDVLIIGLGAPKQELWVHRHRDYLEAKVALCVGATIDFLAGAKSRAPRWMQKLGIEWMHRVLSEPRRLAGRYARDAFLFPQLVWREWWSPSKRPI